MKKILKIILLISPLCLFSSTLGDINELYKNKEYKKAYTQLEIFLKKNPTNIQANLLYASCAYNLSYFDKAMAAYDRVLILDENNTAAKIQEAKIYLRNNNTYMAKLELESLLTLNTLNKQEENYILKLKNTIRSEKKVENKNFKGRLNIGLMYSTNVNDDIGNKSFLIPANNIDYTGEKEKKDFTAFASLNLSYDKDFDNLFGINSSLDIYTNRYFKESQNDLYYILMNISPYYYKKDMQILLPFIFNKVFLDKHSFVNTYGLGVEAVKDIKNTQIDLGYKLLFNKYYGKEKGKNSSNHDLYVGLQSMLSSNTLAYGYIRYSKNKEEKDERTDVNYSSYAVDLGLNQEIYKKLVAKVALSYKNYSYSDLDMSFLNKRKDKIYSYLVGLNYNINNDSYIDIAINYTDKKSNQDLYEYDNSTISSSYTYKF